MHRMGTTRQRRHSARPCHSICNHCLATVVKGDLARYPLVVEISMCSAHGYTSSRTYVPLLSQPLYSLILIEGPEINDAPCMRTRLCRFSVLSHLARV